MLNYRRAIWTRAISDYKEWLRKGRAAVIPFVMQTAIVLALLYFQPWIGSARDESKAVGATVAAILITGILRFLWQVFHAPAAIWSEDRRAIDDFERRLTPRVSVALHNDGRLSELASGGLYLGLKCSNKTDRDMSNCEAFIVGLRPEDGRSDELVDPIALEWVQVSGRPDHFAQMVSGAVRTLLVVHVAIDGTPWLRQSTGSNRENMLDSARNFVGRIAFKEYWGGGTLVDFKIVRAGPEPVLELLGEPLPVDTDQLLDMREGLKA